MRSMAPGFAFVFLLVTSAPVIAEECIKVTKDIGTFTLIKTSNGKMGVFFQTNSNLPIKTVSLSDGKKITGGVPGPVPISFIQFDKSDRLQKINSIRLEFATDRSAGNRVANWYGGDGNQFASSKIKGRPVLLRRNERYSPTPEQAAVKVEFEIPNAIIARVCIDPGPIVANSTVVAEKLGVPPR